MSNNTFPQTLKLILALTIALSAVLRVQAHGGPPRLELVAKQATAGAPLELWGINLGADLPVTVTLIGDGVEYPLGTVICDGHGDFLQTFRLPSELVPGMYTVRAVNASDLVVAEQLEIESSGGFSALNGWIASLHGSLTPLVLGTLAVLFAGLALVFWWRDSRARRDETTSDTSRL